MVGHRARSLARRDHAGPDMTPAPAAGPGPGTLPGNQALLVVTADTAGDAQPG